jgi:eukaryotic-like serine/threonine-protein kinase
MLQPTVCPLCGTRIDPAESAGLGCMACLLRAGLDEEANFSAVIDGIPDSLGGYVIMRHDDGTLWELGRGAMGVTYRAQDLSLERQVALKVINAGFSVRGAEARARFTREARAAAALRHPNVATVHQFGIDEASGHSFYAMELVEGETLEERVRRIGPLDVGTAVVFARQVTSALAAAEKRGLVHRDLKPGNIMVCTENGEEKFVAKVIDFGLAKALTTTPEARTLTHGGFIGTPAFASPEQLNAQPLDIRSDIYSLGATLWYLLTGHMPLGDAAGTAAPPVEQLKAAHVPPRLISLLLSMLALEPAARPSVSELEKELKKIQERLETGMKAPRVWAFATISAAAIGVALVWSSGRQATPPEIPEKSIAVLPFASLGDEEGNAYLTDGIQEEVLTRLAGIADLKVISRTSTQRYQNRPRNRTEIAKQLRVANLLEGSVQKTAEQVRVNVHLINGLTETELWAETYDRKLTDIFAVESEIAETIAETLQVRLTRNEKASITARTTENSEARNLYLKGRYFLAKRTGDDLKRAISYFNQAIAKDDRYASAYAGLADSYGLLPQYSNTLGPEVFQKAKSAAERALACDPNLAEAHVSYALALFCADLDWAGAKRHLQKAIELNPNSATAHYFLGYAILKVFGQFEQAIVEMKRAIELDPLSVIINTNLADCYVFARRYPEAIAQARKAVELEPNFVSAHIILGTALELNGDLAGAKQEYEKAGQIEKASDLTSQLQLGLCFLAHLYALQGDREKASQLLREIEDNEKHGAGIQAANYALIYLALGDKDQAITWLERSYQSRESGEISLIKISPFLDPLRGDPRFERLANQVMPAGLH